MSTPITADITRPRGDTTPIVFTITDPDGTLLLFEGFTFLLTVDPEKAPIDNTNNVFQVVGSSPESGKVQFVPAALDVDLIGTYYYDAQLTDPLGRVTTFAKGKMKFVQDITK